MAASTSVFVVDDHAMVRDGLAALLDAQPDLEVLGTASSVSEAVAAISMRPVDVVVTDYQLGDGTGLDLTGRLREEGRPCAVLLISGLDRPGLVDDAVAAGCDGFVGKGRELDTLADAVRTVAAGSAVFPASALRQMVGGAARATAGDLTPREAEVLQLLAEPRSVDEVAETLFISVHTARNHIRSILTKLGARSQLEAVVEGVKRGIIRIG